MVPYIQSGNVINKLELVFLYHMQYKYEKNFSFQFLELIQDEYRCCDTLWYRTNFDGRLPLSCFKRESSLDESHLYTCPVVLGELVSFRCIIIAVCLFIMLISLIALGVIGILELLGREYDVAAREANAYRISSNGQQQPVEEKWVETRPARNTRKFTPIDEPNQAANNDEEDLKFNDDSELVDNISERLRLDERERQTPLLSKDYLAQQPAGRERPSRTIWNYDQYRKPDQPTADSPSMQQEPTILTRANITSFGNNRAQSPILVNRNNDEIPYNWKNEDSTSIKSITSRNSHSSPTKSALKKSPSIARLESDEEDVESIHEYQRHTQTRRSLLNVRFAE